MEVIFTALNWLWLHKEGIMAIYGAIVAICTIIVKWTPSEKDDTWLAKIIAFLDNFSTAFKKVDAEKLEKLQSGLYKLTKVKGKDKEEETKE